MSEFKFPCPRCGKTIQCDIGYCGSQINCPGCQQPITVPPAGQPGSPSSGESPKKAKRKVLRIVATAVALLLLAFCAVELAPRFFNSLRSNPPGSNPPGLIGWWKLDETSGTTAKDGSGGHKGKLMSDPNWVKGKNGSALQFDGKQYVALGEILQDSYDEISIACWIKHGSSQWQNIVERAVWDQPDGIGLMADYNTTSVTFGHYGSIAAQSKANVQDDRWHHVVGTMAKSGNGYIYSIYVDGKLDNTATGSVGLDATTLGWAIGARHDGTWPYQGLIDDVRIFNRALTPAEVEKLYE